MLVEKNAALLYLSLLAKYLSAIDEEATVPGTDREEYWEAGPVRHDKSKTKIHSGLVSDLSAELARMADRI
jgi:hypothetical protein